MEMPERNIPEAEQLSRIERLFNFGKGVLRALARSSSAFTGTPDAHQQVILGIDEAERTANRTQE